MPSRLIRHDEFGHIHFVTFSCYRRLQFFRHESVRNAFVEVLKQVRESFAIRWLGYVVMPEHVHVLTLPQADDASEPVPISHVLHDLKGLSGKACKAALREVWRNQRSLGTPPLNAWATSAVEKPFWKPRAYDFNVVQEDKTTEKLEYMHMNPVKRELVEHPDQWPWSSYRFYELGDASMISMDWTGAFPI